MKRSFFPNKITLLNIQLRLVVHIKIKICYYWNSQVPRIYFIRRSFKLRNMLSQYLYLIFLHLCLQNNAF